MSDTLIISPENKYKNFTGHKINLKNAKMIKESLESGNCPFLPNENGIIEAKPIVNLNTGYVLKAKDQLVAQVVKQNKGYESDFVATNNTLKKMKTTRKTDVSIADQGFSSNFQTKEGTFSHTNYFFAEETDHPDRFLDYAKKNTKQVAGFKDKTLVANSVDDYLPTYLAAVKSGAKMEVSKEVADEFKENFKKICENELAKKVNKDLEKDSLSQMCFNADVKSNEILKSMKTQTQTQSYKQKKNIENEIDRG